MLFNSSKKTFVLGMRFQTFVLLWEGLAERGSWFIPEGNGFQHLQELCVFLQGLGTGWLLDVITSTSAVFPPFGWIPPIPGEGKEQMG